MGSTSFRISGDGRAAVQAPRWCFAVFVTVLALAISGSAFGQPGNADPKSQAVSDADRYCGGFFKDKATHDYAVCMAQAGIDSNAVRAVAGQTAEQFCAEFWDRSSPRYDACVASMRSPLGMGTTAARGSLPQASAPSVDEAMQLDLNADQTCGGLHSSLDRMQPSYFNCMRTMQHPVSREEAQLITLLRAAQTAGTPEARTKAQSALKLLNDKGCVQYYNRGTPQYSTCMARANTPVDKAEIPHLAQLRAAEDARQAQAAAQATVPAYEQTTCMVNQGGLPLISKPCAKMLTTRQVLSVAKTCPLSGEMPSGASAELRARCSAWINDTFVCSMVSGGQDRQSHRATPSADTRLGALASHLGNGAENVRYVLGQAAAGKHIDNDPVMVCLRADFPGPPPL